jgi:DNA-binding winged helix-turn-helix (wHTH) protein
LSAGTERAVDEIISFGSFQLEPIRRLLTRGGVPVRIGDRALDILMVLAAHAPEIVGKNTLIEQVWSGLQVEESNLRFQMIALRKTLDDGDYISTVQGRGYCLVVPVERSRGTPAAAAELVVLEAAASLPTTNLPQYLTGIVGRSSELAKLRDCLDENRLITLVGPGGVGKTRLAVELGHQMLQYFPGGALLVDLAPLSDPVSVVNATAVVLRTTFSTMEVAVDAIVSALGRQRSLLIFDNCEHLVAAVAGLIKSLLERVPGLAVLATSQQALQLPAEQIYLVPPLSVPPDEAADICGFGAAELFVERARAADRSFTLDRRSMAESSRSAAASTACRWRSKWPRACTSWVSTACATLSTTASIS